MIWQRMLSLSLSPPLPPSLLSSLFLTLSLSLFRDHFGQFVEIELDAKSGGLFLPPE